MIKKILQYGISNLFPMMSGLLITILLTKELTVEEYGEYSLILINIGILGGVCFSWLNSSLLRFYKKYELINKEEIFLKNYYIYFFTVSLLILLTSLVFALKNPMIFTLSMAIITLNLNSLKLTMYRVNNCGKKYMFQNIFLNLLNVIVVYIAVLYFQLSILGAILGYIIPSLILNFKDFLYLKEIKKFRIEKYFLKESLYYGIPIIGITIANQVLVNIDRYMLKYFKGDEIVGYYSFIYKVSDLSLSKVTMILMLIAFPAIIESYEKKGMKESKKTILKYFKYYLLLSIPFGLFLIFLMPIIVEIYFEKYTVVLPLLKYIMFGTFLSGVTQYINKPLELRKQTKQILYLVLVAAFCNFIFNLYLIPKYSYYGATYSTVFSYMIYIIISFLFMNFKEEGSEVEKI